MTRTHRPFGLGLATTGLLALGGCGFTPLYAVKGVTSQLASIQVSRPDGHTGFLLGQSLDAELGRDEGTPAQYKLNLNLSEVRVGRGINVNNVATEYEVDLSANYQLVDVKTGAQVTKGVVAVNATYDTATQPYASVADELDAERRVADAAAERIRLELAAYFASPHPTGAIAPPKVLASPFVGVTTASPIQSPRERAEGAADPGAGDLPDPYGQQGGAGPLVSP